MKPFPLVALFCPFLYRVDPFFSRGTRNNLDCRAFPFDGKLCKHIGNGAQRVGFKLHIGAQRRVWIFIEHYARDEGCAVGMENIVVLCFLDVRIRKNPLDDFLDRVRVAARHRNIKMELLTHGRNRKLKRKRRPAVQKLCDHPLAEAREIRIQGLHHRDPFADLLLGELLSRAVRRKPDQKKREVERTGHKAFFCDAAFKHKKREKNGAEKNNDPPKDDERKIKVV